MIDTIPDHVQKVLDRFDEVVDSGDGWKALCPHHDDVEPSLHISVGDKGGILLHCHAGCKVGSVLNAAGLTFKDLKPQKGVVTSRKLETYPEDTVLRMKVYADFLGQLELLGDDRESLRKRGLSDAAIDANWYRSLTPVSCARVVRNLVVSYGVSLLARVPGFKAEGTTVTTVLQTGLVLPVMSPDRKILGLQIRTGGTPKYVWFSGNGSPSVGAPAHVAMTFGQTSQAAYVTEGPLKADVIRSLMDCPPVVGVAGVSNWRSALPVLETLGAKMVWLAFDMDWREKPGVKAALWDLAKELHRTKYQVCMATWEGHKGLDDALLAKAEITPYIGVDRVREVLFGTPAEVETEPDDPEWYDDVVGADEVEPEPIRWLWKGWLAYGKIHVIDGDPGLSKSTFCVDLMARLTTGRPMPPRDTDIVGEAPVNVLVLSAEDSLSDVLVPRLITAGAERSRVKFFRGVFSLTSKSKCPILLPQHLSNLKRVIRKSKSRFVVIDPIFAYMDGAVDSHRDQDVRLVLSALKDIAEETDSCILMVRHYNKTPGGKLLHKGSGSIGIVAGVRTALGLVQHPSSESRKILGVAKTNLGKKPPDLVYRLDADGPDSPPRIIWEGTSNLKLEDVVQKDGDKSGNSLLDEAKKFLTKSLAGGAELFTILVKDALKNGISDTTLRRAKAELGVESRKTSEGWVWELPKGGEDAGR